jgi:hypothetical protein
MDLKCSTYGPEHKTERFRSIEVIVNFWEPVEIGKNVYFSCKIIFKIPILIFPTYSNIFVIFSLVWHGI